MSGKLLIFSAPSGSGKTSIVKHLLSSGLNLEFSISATSREIRGDEVDGKDYYYFSAEEFKDRIDRDEFAEWEEVYKDHYYGTLKSEIKRIWNNGNHVLFDIDVVGGLNLKNIYGDNARSIFIRPPSVDTLRERLVGRATDSADKIEMRLKKCEEEMQRAEEFDVVIVNDILKDACNEAYNYIHNFINE